MRSSSAVGPQCPLGVVMFRVKFLIGCVFIVAGIVWPTVSIQRGLAKYSSVYGSAVQARREIDPPEKREVITAVEQGGASILGGFLVGLFGIGLALGKKRGSVVATGESSAYEVA